MKKQLLRIVLVAGLFVGSPTASSYTIDQVSTPSVLTGLWWNANESGWGLTITQQFSVIFVAMYTYDAANNPVWYVITNCPVVAGGCTGDIFKVNGGSPLTAVWKPNLALTKVGSGSLAFSDNNTATMNFTIDGIAGSKAITRQVFATSPVFPFAFSAPDSFNSIRTVQLNSLSFASAGSFCNATLSFTNTSTVAIGVNLIFDTLVGSAITGQLVFGSAVLNLAPGATTTSTSTAVNNGGPIACNAFTFQFNASKSRYF